MMCVCDFYLIGVRRTDKLFIFPLFIISFIRDFQDCEL
jgi:hypothetical protein